MNEIIKVDFEKETVSARELYGTLGIEKRFSAWFETNSQGFVEGEDFTSVPTSTVVNNGAERVLDDYQLTMDMAKHICLMSRSEKGKECRQYLIDLEKAWNTPEQIMARALKVADHTITGLKAQIETLKPKADFFDAVADSKTAISMNEVAKVLNVKGYGRNNLFEYLRNEGILDRYNVPYQRYVDNGWFRVIEQHYQKNGEPVVTTKTLVYQKGVDAISRKLAKVTGS
jgi:anti-repressor protein